MSKSILIVEDETVFARVAGGASLAEGYEVLQAGDGKRRTRSC